MVVIPLFPYDEQLRFDLFSITLAPGALSESSPHDIGVIEHVTVISGVLEMRTQGKWQVLQAGQGLRFAADVAHSYRNSGVDNAHFHSLIHYPNSSSCSVR